MMNQSFFFPVRVRGHRSSRGGASVSGFWSDVYLLLHSHLLVILQNRREDLQTKHREILSVEARSGRPPLPPKVTRRAAFGCAVGVVGLLVAVSPSPGWSACDSLSSEMEMSGAVILQPTAKVQPLWTETRTAAWRAAKPGFTSFPQQTCRMLENSFQTFPTERLLNGWEKRFESLKTGTAAAEVGLPQVQTCRKHLVSFCWGVFFRWF